VGKIPADECKIVQQAGMMEITDLFEVRQNSETYNESGDHRSSLVFLSPIWRPAIRPCCFDRAQILRPNPG